MRLVVIVFAAAAAAFGQSFEVASIRPHETPLHSIMGWSASGPRLTLEAWQAHALIHEAYNLDFFRIVVPPAVRSETYYDVVAKAPGAAAPTRDEFRAMLRALLADRFRLEFHREQREIPVYVLAVAKGGPKFKPSAPDATAHFLGSVNGRNQVITATRYTMADLARGLRDFLGADRPVVDQTGLSGEYDLRIEATPGFRRDSEFGDLSVFTAVQDQLGLKLEPRKAPIEVLVVDRLDKPSAN